MEENNNEKKEVVLRPKSKVASFVSLFIADDMDAVKAHIVHDIIVPSVKEVLVNSFASFINGAGYRKNKNYWTSNNGYYSYNRGYQAAPKTISPTPSMYSRNETPQLMDFQRIPFETADIAEAVLDALDDEAGRSQFVPVARIWEYAHLDVPSATFYDYGWPSEQISMAKYKMNLVMGDYYIYGLPRPISIKR